MKRLITLVLAVVALFLGMSAQDGLKIQKAFNGSLSGPMITETYISGENSFLKKNSLTKLMLIKGPADMLRDKIEPWLQADASKAIGRNENYSGAKLTYASYILKPIKVNKREMNRYIYFNVTKKGQLMLLYLEGTLDIDKANSLFSRNK